MTSKSKAFIAGIGISSPQSGGSDKQVAATTIVSAAAKALLDAGVTYDDVTRGVKGKSLNEGAAAFRAFDDEAVSVDEAGDRSELSHAVELVTDRGEQCVLVASFDEVKVPLHISARALCKRQR